MTNSPQDDAVRDPDSKAVAVPAVQSLALRPVARADRNADTPDAMTPRRILDALRYWWKWALPAGMVLAAGAGALVLAAFRPVYEASALLRIEERVPFIAFESREHEQSKAFVETQLELLRSPLVLKPALAALDVSRVEELREERDRVGWLARQIKARGIGRSELYTVALALSDPQAAADVVNAVVNSYFELRRREEGGRRKLVTQILTNETSRRTEEVKRLRESVRELAKQATGKDPFGGPEDPTQSPARPLTDLANRIVAAEVEESVLAAKLQVLEAADAKRGVEVPESVIERAVSESPQVQKAAAALAERKSALADLESRLARGKEDPAFQRAAKAVAQEEQVLEQLKAAMRKQAKEQLETSVEGKRGEEVAALRADLESRRVIKELLKERYQSELKSAKKFSGDTLNLKFKQDELARAERVLELISERVLRLNTEEEAPPRVVQLAQAEVPTVPVQRLPYRNLILAVVAGFCLPFGLAIAKEQVTRRVTDSEGLERQAHLAVIGEIARLPSRSTSARRLGHRERRAVHLFEESMDALRTSLFLSAAKGPRILAVTSAVNQEGKTSVSAQLAVSVARAFRELTLIIDGDMRSPDIHKVLQVPLEPGLTKVLAGECDIRDAIVPFDEKVHILPAGKLHVNPHTLVSNGALDSLVSRIPAEYRFVIIDTPPVLAASEALVLAKASDGVLMCTMRDVSRVSQVKKATDRLVGVGSRVLGIVLSGIPTRQYVRRYGSYRYVEPTED